MPGEKKKREKGRPKAINPKTMMYTTLALPKDLLKRFDHLMIDLDINVRWKMIDVLVTHYENSFKPINGEEDA